MLRYWFSVQSESLPPGALPDSQSESLPPGVLADSQSVSLPPGVPADLQSAVKKCSTTFPWGFAIPILFICISFYNNRKNDNNTIFERNCFLGKKSQSLIFKENNVVFT